MALGKKKMLHQAATGFVATENFATKLYTGNGGSQSITGLDFQPDLVWIKDRDSSLYDPVIFDSVRGVNKYIFPSLTNAEGTSTTLTSFDSNGFSLNTSGAGINANGNDHVAWCFNAGTGAAASNTDGTITSTVKANQDAGFSIVKYTGNASNSTVGHGLSVAPDLIITKGIDSVVGNTNWLVYNSISGATGRLQLNKTDAFTTSSTSYNNTEPTSSVFTIGTTGDINGNGAAYIAYCFTSITGYQSVGSYTGNGSANGPTITTGFKPRWIMVKATSNAGGWVIMDAVRDAGRNDFWYRRLQAQIPDAEVDDFGSQSRYQILDTGFKITNASNSWNGSGRSYIYLAIA